MSILIVLLPTGPVSGATEFPYVVSPDGRSLATSGRAAASLLPAKGGPGSEVVAVVPAEALSWHRLDWPRGLSAGTPRLRAALEGLLEEQLLDDPETLHFAVEPGGRAGAPVWVAACDRAWIKSSLAQLEAAGQAPHRLVPEVAPGSPSLLLAVQGPAREGSDETPWLISRSASGIARLPLSAEALELLPPLDEDTLLLAEPAVSAQAESMLQRHAVLQPAGQRWLQAAQSRWDLAQFDLLRSGRTRLLKTLAGVLSLLRSPAWRPARWAALAVVLAHLAGLNAWAWAERRALEARRVAIQDTLTRNFPQVKVVIDAPLQMAREVAALRQTTGAPAPGDLETLLGALSQFAGDQVAKEIRYDPQGLRVSGLEWSDPQLQGAAPALRTQGIRATLDGEILVLRAEGTP
jgi:general secretion pathway protein L